MAVDASSVSVVLGAPGTPGSSQVVTTAGVVFVQGANPPASSPYWSYNGTNLVGNVPTGKGFSFTVNGTEQINFSNAGKITTNGLQVGIATNQINNSDNSASLQLVQGAAATLNGSTGTIGVYAVGATPTTYGGQASLAHLTGGSTALTPGIRCAVGLGAGTTSSGTAVTASGHDLAGRVGVTINSTGTANQPILLITWANAFNTPPFVTLTPGNAATAALAVNVKPFVVTTTTGMSIMGNATGITTGGTYVWYYGAVIQ